jgi:hypothetical protein
MTISRHIIRTGETEQRAFISLHDFRRNEHCREIGRKIGHVDGQAREDEESVISKTCHQTKGRQVQTPRYPDRVKKKTVSTMRQLA